MKISIHLIIIAVFLLASPVTLMAGQKVDPATQKLRDNLRNTMIQLRDVTAKLAEAQEKATELQTALDELTKKTDLERKVANETIDDLKTKLSSSEMQVIHLSESLAKWKEGYYKISEYAKATEGKRADLASKVILLDRRVADQQVKNAEMYRLGNEVLDRYAQFGLGTAISAREPFVGITKVKFQNLVQDYQNKMTEQTTRIQPVEKSQPAK